jgi:hypothetical protein
MTSKTRNPLSSAALLLFLFAAVAPPIRAADDAARGCPLRFDADTICLPETCLFVGRYNGSCGDRAVAIFAGNGEHLVVGFAFSQTGAPTYFAGTVASQTAATLAAWQPTLDDPATRMLPGSATLEEDGEVLRVRLTGAPFQVDGCEFGEFVGRFVQMIEGDQGIAGALPTKSVRGGRLTVNSSELTVFQFCRPEIRQGSALSTLNSQLSTVDRTGQVNWWAKTPAGNRPAHLVSCRR